MDNVFYVAYDADSAGSKIGQAIIADDPHALEDASQRIQLGNEIIEEWSKKWGGTQYSSGGDQGLFALPEEALSEIEMIRADYEHATNLTISVGIGKTLSESGKALIVAKFWGKNMAVQYSPEVEKEIDSANAKISEGTANFEEQKLGTAYLQPEEMVIMENEEQNADANHKDCPYCEAMDQEKIQDPDHCVFCHDDSETECPYCKEDVEHNPSAEDHPENCPLCTDESQKDFDISGDDQSVSETGGPKTQLPTTTSSQDFIGQDLNSPDLPKPDAISANPDGLAFDAETQTNENGRLDEKSDEESDEEAATGGKESKDSVQSVVDEIEELPPTEGQARQEQASVDGEDEDGSGGMKENVSHPADFPSNVPGDMGLGETGDDSPDNSSEESPEASPEEYADAPPEETADYSPEEDPADETPDLSSVLKEGLDSQADNIQRERVVQLTAEALEGFKGCKDILERAKEQAPQLYESAIAMLKAMIEMAKLLGLDKEAEQHASLEDDQSLNGDGGQSFEEDGGEEAGDENGNIPDYEIHPDSHAADDQSAAGNDEELSGGSNIPDYEIHPDSHAAAQGGAVDNPKLKGQLANQ